MTVDDTGQEDGQALSDGHDYGEGDRAEHLDGVEDEELAGGRADGEEYHVVHEGRVGSHKGERLEEGALLQERGGREEHGEEVHAQHHLDGRHLVTLVQLALPVGREGVEEEVTTEEYHAGERGHGAVAADTVLTGQYEHTHPGRDHQSCRVLVVLECLP